MQKTAEFVAKHINDDVTRLILEKGKWPEIDMDIVVNSIESRRKLRGKMDEWIENPSLVFPAKLSAEQCSSSATGRYKAALACKIMLDNGRGESGWSLADLTGGLGVDSWFFSQKAAKVLYCEMQHILCNAAKHNFHVLGADNITVKNCFVLPTGHTQEGAASISELLQEFPADMVFIDPARRGEGGKKVFLIEDCTPDVLTLKEEIFSHCRHILLKLSPMADISMACSRLGCTCREVHVVAASGECKELLIWMDKEWNSEYSIHAVSLPNGYPASEEKVMTFTPSEEKAACMTLTGKEEDLKGKYLFEPGKALMKAGAFNLTSSRYGLKKLGASTHYYIADDIETVSELIGHGKVFRILESEPLNKRSIRQAGKEHPKAEVTARNIPMDTDTLRKRLGVSSGDSIHIFGLKSDTSGNLLVRCTFHSKY